MGADGFTYLSEAARIERAANGLADAHPHLSARGGLTQTQRGVLIGLCLTILALACFWPGLLYWIAFALFAALILWRAALLMLAMTDRRSSSSGFLSDDDLPPYSVLVALYDEAESAGGLIRALSQMNYPPSKLDIHLLLEASDTSTRAALDAISLPANVRVHTLAPGTPQTKPRALNYGLEFAAGKYVTIYDAEDRPHPDQIRIAAEEFASAHETLACLQAPLQAHNASDSWIASQWALEYDIQFRLLVPALARAQLPIPLGGTSNHFDRAALDAAGGWDAWNVTEDADLGLRLARMGKTIGSIAPPTLEEAPAALPVWAAQRSRWIKGFIQSWWVLMRSPARSFREVGALGWLAAQLTLGGAILSALLAGPMAIWLLVCLLVPQLSFGAAGLLLLVGGYGVNIVAAALATRRWTFSRALTVASLPLYWPLLSLGAARALYGLMRTPHFWAKTPHGLSVMGIDEGAPICSPSTGYSP